MPHNTTPFTNIHLRPATPADNEYCYQLHHATMSDYIRAAWGWDTQAQRDYHNREFTPGQWQIITLNDTAIGVLNAIQRPTEVYLTRLEIHPDHQGQGIGGQLIRDLLHRTTQNGYDLTLDVLAVNQQAHALYRRLGLHEVARHGPNNTRIRMSSNPDPTKKNLITT